MSTNTEAALQAPVPPVEKYLTQHPSLKHRADDPHGRWHKGEPVQGVFIFGYGSLVPNPTTHMTWHPDRGDTETPSYLKAQRFGAVAVGIKGRDGAPDIDGVEAGPACFDTVYRGRPGDEASRGVTLGMDARPGKSTAGAVYFVPHIQPIPGSGKTDPAADALAESIHRVAPREMPAGLEPFGRGDDIVVRRPHVNPAPLALAEVHERENPKTMHLYTDAPLKVRLGNGAEVTAMGYIADPAGDHYIGDRMTTEQKAARIARSYGNPNPSNPDVPGPDKTNLDYFLSTVMANRQGGRVNPVLEDVAEMAVKERLRMKFHPKDAQERELVERLERAERGTATERYFKRHVPAEVREGRADFTQLFSTADKVGYAVGHQIDGLRKAAAPALEGLQRLKAMGDHLRPAASGGIA